MENVSMESANATINGLETAVKSTLAQANAAGMVLVLMMQPWRPHVLVIQVMLEKLVSCTPPVLLISTPAARTDDAQTMDHAKITSAFVELGGLVLNVKSKTASLPTVMAMEYASMESACVIMAGLENHVIKRLVASTAVVKVFVMVMYVFAMKAGLERSVKLPLYNAQMTVTSTPIRVNV
jgi:hypothetical protein